ncbi:hypothetical protein CR970_04685 [Candidatus Saccharibacteria bacterium]|nr:MAG: hypothetical protein CR970_04685 [Candidatus Saccharibacteria bacterium]
MYSGTTLTKYSGRVLGAHQKIDRVSRRHLARLAPGVDVFPSIRSILLFEGRDGPDGVKRKSPAHNEPWHYYNPFDEHDDALPGIIASHYQELIRTLRDNNTERAAFEAAWLAHAIVDGLTPAHHYPYEEELCQLRCGGIEERTTIFKKIIIPGSGLGEIIANNWKMWGGKGLMTTHGTFEWGVATMIKPLTLSNAMPTAADLEVLYQNGPVAIFRRTAHEIALLDMYERYYQKGWTPALAAQVRSILAPAMVRTVTLAWYGALVVSMGLASERPAGGLQAVPAARRRPWRQN